MANKRSKRRSKRRTTRSKQQGYPGWAWMLFGLAIGLSVALAIYMRDIEHAAAPTAEPRSVKEPVAAAMDSALDDNGERSPVAVTEEPATEEKESRFTFYEMLKNMEVVVPDERVVITRDDEPRAVIEPGLYVLQAGSFSSHDDADRRRAELALQGIESRIQVAEVNGRTYHRVHIGPTDDLDELNVLRSRLRAARIDVLRIRLGE